MRDGLPEAGDVIADKYVVDYVLGRGGMGTVYAVTHRLTGKRLALKCLLPSYLNNPNVVERFLREARTAGRIQHRHVIDVFDAGREGDVLYIVMPLLEGKSLAELLHDTDLTLEEALVILVRAMEGVAAAHEQGILHRDLKPGNIFVCLGVSGRLDDPRVLDFGISKLQDELNSPLTRSGVAVGTPYYMPLEQMTGQRDLDQRVDVYALGVILYEAMTGRPPHTADNIAALAIQLMHAPPRHLGWLRPELPSGLADVVMRAIQRDRELRFDSVRALIDALLPYIPQSAGLTMPEPQGSPLRTPRDVAEPAFADEMARASAPTAPSTPPGSPDPVRLPAPSTPVPAGTQGSLPPVTGESVRRTRRVVGALLVATAVVALGRLVSAPADERRPTQGMMIGSPGDARAVPAPAAHAVDASTRLVAQAPRPTGPAVEPSPQVDASTSHGATRAKGLAKERAPRVLRTPSRALGDAGSGQQHAQVMLAANTHDAAVAAPVTPKPVPQETRGGSLAPDEF